MPHEITSRKHNKTQERMTSGGNFKNLHTWKQANIKSQKTLAKPLSELADTCPKLATETIAKCVKLVQNKS